MKTAGIIGGVSWHSSMQLYEYINQYAAETLGGLNCAKIILFNVNLNDIIQAKTFEEKGAILADAAKRIEAAGGDFLAICSNGLHQYADVFTADLKIPFIHIADATADAIIKKGYKSVGLLGVKSTMEADFYKSRLFKKGLSVIIPPEADRDFIEDVLFKETGVGIVKPESSLRFYQISEELVKEGAECIILGCTEIGMLMKQEDTDIPLFDTTKIHAETIAKLCLSNEIEE